MVRARVTEAPSGKAVEGALVSLRTTRNQTVRQALSDFTGRATLPVPRSEYYRLRADRIGFVGAMSDSFFVGVADTIAVVLTVPSDRVMLPELAVVARSKPECKLDPESGSVIARLWDEARKTLSTTVLSRANVAASVEATTYRRELDRSFRVIKQTSSTQPMFSGRPFITAPPEFISEHGYVQRGEDESTYFAPDEQVLLSDLFLQQHCFDLKAGFGETAGMLGLGFKPVRSREVSEIEGVLWLDQESAELRSVDFHFVNVDLAGAGDRSGGHLQFAKLGNGSWVVGRWQLRTPIIGTIITNRTRLAPKERLDTLMGFVEAGGEVLQPLSATGRPILSGIAYDSSSGRPLAGVGVAIRGTEVRTITDSNGAYRLELSEPGDYEATFDHPQIRLLLGTASTSVHVGRDRVSHADVAIGPGRRLLHSLCPSAGPTAGEFGLITGRVVDGATKQPIPQAMISVNLRSKATLRPGRPAEVGPRGISYTVSASGEGIYRVCGLRLNEEVRLTPERGTKLGPSATLVVTADQVVVVKDLEVPR